MSEPDTGNICGVCGADQALYMCSCLIEPRAQPTPSAYTRGWNDALEAVAKWHDSENNRHHQIWKTVTGDAAMHCAGLSDEHYEASKHVRSLKKP